VSNVVSGRKTWAAGTFGAGPPAQRRHLLPAGRRVRHQHNHGVASGTLLWTSDGLPGSVHDLTAARAHGVIIATAAAEIQTLADKGYQGAGGTTTTPIKGRNLTAGQTPLQLADQPQARPWRTRLRHPESLEDPHQGPLLPTPYWSDYAQVRLEMAPSCYGLHAMELEPLSARVSAAWYIRWFWAMKKTPISASAKAILSDWGVDVNRGARDHLDAIRTPRPDA
jgi:hypothetical protein